MGGANLEWVEKMWAEQCGELLTIWRRRCSVSFYFVAIFFKLDNYICWFSCEI